MKDLFAGSLGRLNNHGGSRIFTTPNTIHIPDEYEISTDVPSIAEFVTCSLDGRLWIWKRSRRFYIVALKWDEDSKSLVFAKTTTLNSINIIGRGIDWIITDSMIIQVSDAGPYIFTANLFDDSRNILNDGENIFLYSQLRSKVFPSGIDPTTNYAWGLSEDNGNSEGYGYFKRSTFFQSVDKNYSLLPAVGDWNIISNFLVRRQDNPLSDIHNSMLNIRPLIPLEFVSIPKYFLGGNPVYETIPAYGSGFDNDIFITYHKTKIDSDGEIDNKNYETDSNDEPKYKGELWTRGLYHIGKAYILPAVFAEDGSPQEFYLYISPDCSCILFNRYFRVINNKFRLANEEGLNMSIIHTDNKIYGFWAKKPDTDEIKLNESRCHLTESPKLFDVYDKAFLQLPDDGSLFIDTLNNSGLVLRDEEAIFINNEKSSYNCKGLPQWLDPAENIEAVSPQFVISSADNLSLVTHVKQGFFREALINKKLPLSATAFSDKRLSLGFNDSESKKTITVNSMEGLEGIEGVDNIPWDDVYKPAVSIRYINSFARNFVDTFCDYPVFCSKYNVLSTVLPYDENYEEPGERTAILPEESPVTVLLNHAIGYGLTSEGDVRFPALKSEVNASVFYVDPESGTPHDITLEATFSSVIPTETRKHYHSLDDNDYTLVIHYIFEHPDAVADIPLGISIQDGKIGFSYNHYTNGGATKEILFHPCKTFPDNILRWDSSNKGKLSLTSVGIPSKIFTPHEKMFPHKLQNGMAASAFAIFSENDSNTNFLCDIPSALYIKADGYYSGNIAECNYIGECFTFRDSNSPYENDDTLFKNGLHIANFYKSLNSYQCQFLVFRSEIYPEIFDFHSETERSRIV